MSQFETGDEGIEDERQQQLLLSIAKEIWSGPAVPCAVPQNSAFWLAVSSTPGDPPALRFSCHKLPINKKNDLDKRALNGNGLNLTSH